LVATRPSDVRSSNDSDSGPTEEQLPTFVPTLTLPDEAYGHSLETGDSGVATCRECPASAARVSALSVNTAV
jgi:hypothetical protein